MLNDDDMIAPRRINCELLKNANANQIIYDILLERKYKDKELIKYVNRWNEKLDEVQDYFDFLQLFKRIYSTTDSVKLQDFQYQLLLGKIFVNDILYRWGIVDTNTCHMCNATKQTIVHFLVECPAIKHIWTNLQELIPLDNTRWTKSSIFSNRVHNSPKHVINFIVLITKQFIFTLWSPFQWS